MRFLKGLRTVVLIILGLAAAILAAAAAVYSPEYVYRVVVWQESDAFDWQKFPSHPLTASPAPFHFESAPDPRVAEVFEDLSGSANWEDFLAANHTQAFLVIQDGKILYENYFNGAGRDSIVTSFSVAKSFVSTLIGMAVEDGYIRSIDQPITDYLPELAGRDPRFKEITIRHLLLMASGLEFEEFRPLLFNSDDILSSYYPDQRKISLENTPIILPPGQVFDYNKYHPQLLGMILERSTGMTVTAYMQARLWDRVGMEYPGSWSTDSLASDFERMETGVNARAVDFAKLGVLFLNGGRWQGDQVISQSWVDEATSPLLPADYDGYYSAYFNQLPGKGFYKYMWWGFMRGEGYDFSAAGDKGQYIYVSPAKNLVIVRHGIDFGISDVEWFQLFYDFSTAF